MSQLRLRASPPAVPPGLVPRRHLETLLTRSATLPVTLLSAGPGSGKTLSVASWLSGGGFRGGTAWLTVDVTDNDLAAFWADVLGALTVGDVLPTDSALREVLPAAGFGPAQALQVRAGLAELPVPVLLVLDDFQEITDTAVLDSLNQLLDRQPPNMRLVLITRADPALRLHRVRVAGGLAEIRSPDLAFTETEAAELFARSDLDLTSEQVRVLFGRTQGWPAGLRLAAMSLTSGDPTSDPADEIARFTGTQRSVAEYFIGEVLDRLPQSDRDFLLKTSITDRLSAPLANALTGRVDSQLILEALVTANAFVVSVGGPNTWFRYHPLLRDLLQHRLSLELPGTPDDLQQRAARWFTEQGEPIPALRHATLARDWNEVGRLLTSTALPLILTPAGPALAATLEPAAIRATQVPALGTLLAAGVCHYHRHDFASMLRDANAAAEFLDSAADDLRIPAEILIAIMVLTFDRTRGTGALVDSSTRLLTLLDSAPRRLVPAAPHYRTIGLNNLGVGQLWAGELADAGSSLTAALTNARQLGMGLAEMSAQAHLSVLQVMHGQLGAALAQASAAQQVVDRRGWAVEPQALGLYVALGMALLAQDRLDEAADIISAGLAASSNGSDTSCRLALGITAVGIAAAHNDAAAARSAATLLLAELDKVTARPDLLARWCAVAQAQARLVAGDPAGAIAAIRAPAGADPGYPAALERVAMAKAHLAMGRPQLLAELLAPLLEPDLPYLAPAVEARVLLAVAAERQHRDSAALAAITEAIDLARPEGIRRPFLDAGPAAAALIGRHRHLVSGHLDFTEHLLPATAAGRPVPLLPEQLTERELIVLRYLPTMLKAAEIANDLFVTVNTVKSHLRAIYRKLDVTTRRGAVERGRELNLL
jgi:LuxR family maltose regulon positive regulatory protein